MSRVCVLPMVSSCTIACPRARSSRSVSGLKPRSIRNSPLRMSWWMRGMLVASAMFMPKSTTSTMVCITVPGIVLPPGLPVTIHSLPSRNSIVGDMLDTGRRPGPSRLATVFRASLPALACAPVEKLPIRLPSRKPVPSTITPLPKSEPSV